MPSAQPLASISHAERTPSASTADAIQHDRRLRILHVLAQAPAGLSNEAVLKQAVLTLGHAVSTDLLRTELAWLDEQGLIALTVARGLYVARLLDRGADVGSGRAFQPGVGAPST